MMEKKYQLVAWTRKSSEEELPELRLIPSLHHELQEKYIREISRYLNSDEYIENRSQKLAELYEMNADFYFITGHYGDGIRFLCKAALYSIDDDQWVEYDTDLGSYSCLCGFSGQEFNRLYDRFRTMVKKYRRHDILLENEPQLIEKIHDDLAREDKDLLKHLKRMKAWK
jgi:hypothetical protein